MDARIMMGSSQPIEARALFARMTTPPSNARKAQIAKLIRSIKKAGVWSQLDVLYVFAAADSQAALLNWKGSVFNATNNGAAFAPDRWFTGNGTSAYIATGFSIGSGTTSPSDIMFGAVIRSVPTDSWKQAIGAQDGSGNTAQISVLPYGLSGAISRGSDTALQVGLSGAANIQMQKSGSVLTGYRNGLLLGTRPSTLNVTIGASFNICAGNNAGTPVGYFDGHMSAAYFGRSLSADQAVALDAALQTYLTAVGA